MSNFSDSDTLCSLAENTDGLEGCNAILMTISKQGIAPTSSPISSMAFCWLERIARIADNKSSESRRKEMKKDA